MDESSNHIICTDQAKDRGHAELPDPQLCCLLKPWQTENVEYTNTTICDDINAVQLLAGFSFDFAVSLSKIFALYVFFMWYLEATITTSR